MDNPKLPKIGQEPVLEHHTKAEIKSDLAPMLDPGTGQALILRQFEFYFDPLTINKIIKKQIPAPTKQELFNSNWPQIRIILWGDGLVANQDVEPRVVVSKKKYKIFLLCIPRTKQSGVKEMVADRPQNLSEILNKSA